MGGEANYIQGLGDIVRARSEYETARAHYEEGLVLYRRVGNVLCEAEMMVKIGYVRRKSGDLPAGLSEIESGFALFFTVADSKNRALPGWRAVHRALTCGDPIQAEKNRDEARSLWTAIGALALVHEWVDLIK